MVGCGVAGTIGNTYPYLACSLHLFMNTRGFSVIAPAASTQQADRRGIVLSDISFSHKKSNLTVSSMAQPIKGPGVLFVRSAINPSPQNPLTDAEFMHWYDDDHIAEIVQTSGISNAFRYFHCDKIPDNGTPTAECPRPYLAFYPMPELAFTQSQEFKDIRAKSDILPGTGICYDMADFDIGMYALAGQSGTGKGGTSDKRKPSVRVC